MANTETFTSSGFDLDNIESTSNGEDVVLELGGGVTVIPSEETNKTKNIPKEQTQVEQVLIESEEYKAEGNAKFKAKDYEGAYDGYTDAIEKCPGDIKGEDIMQMKEDFDAKEREKANERNRKEREKRSRIPNSPNDNSSNTPQQQEKDKTEPSAVFKPPHHPHAKALSIYHSNRAATCFHLERYSDCIKDCTISMYLNPLYVKPFLRRSAAYEATEQIAEALEDMKEVMKLDNSNKFARKEVRRLEKLEEERLEKLKAETMGKLKDLGNSILGNFGLSLDNFQAVKDPNTGSYSINFNNSK